MNDLHPQHHRVGPLPGPAPVAHYPLKISTDRRRLLDADGRPFLIQGDAAWSLIANLTYDEAIRYLGESARRKEDDLLGVRIDPAFRSLRADPRYRAIVAVEGFASAQVTGA